MVSYRPILLVIGMASLLAFQNCAKFGSESASTLALNARSITLGHAGAPECSFNGSPVTQDGIVVAFQQSTVAAGADCVSEQRICHDGQLSGSFQFATCAVNVAASCWFNGVTVASGQSLQAYPVSSVPVGSVCVPETRVCTDGKLSGSAAYASCAVAQPAACLFNGHTIASGSSVVAFTKATAPAGGDCASYKEVRQCTNDILSGSATFASCNALPPLPMPMPPPAGLTCHLAANPSVTASFNHIPGNGGQITTNDPVACAQYCQSVGASYCQMLSSGGTVYCASFIGSDYTLAPFGTFGGVTTIYGGACQ